MRYLYDNLYTKDYLQSWAEPRILVTASCFFWNPGIDIQKSLTGLLRSLLYELLQQMPTSAKAVNPWRWQSYELGASKLPDRTGREVEDGFRNLCHRAQDWAKICLFVDGLDEFDGDDIARAELIKLFGGVSSLSHVKVCVLSRPWLIFKDAFRNPPSLRLQDLTHNDIRNFV